MRIRRLLGAALTVPVLIGGLLLVSARPAVACTCAIRTEAQVMAAADVVFVGRLVSSRVDPARLAPEFRDRQREQRRRLAEGLVDPRQRAAVAEQLDRYLASWDPVVLTFEVGRVYKGTVGDRQEIVIPQPLAGGSCGDYVPSGPGPWLIMAHRAAGSTYRLDPGQYLSGFSSCPGGSRALANGGHPDLGPASGLARWPATTQLVVGVAVLVLGVAGGLGLASLRARHRTSAD